MDRSNHERRLALASPRQCGAYGGDQVSDARPVSLVCCGVIGTTVTDNGMVERAYAEAIATQGVVTGTTAYARCMAGVHRSRGQSTIEVLRGLFPESQARAQAAQLAFDRSYSAAVARTGVVAMPGAEQAIDKLHGTGARVCLISGFSRRVLAGTHTKERLRRAGATHVLGSVAELPDLLAAGTGPDTPPAVRQPAVRQPADSGDGARDDSAAAQVRLEPRS